MKKRVENDDNAGEEDKIEKENLCYPKADEILTAKG